DVVALPPCRGADYHILYANNRPRGPDAGSVTASRRAWRRAKSAGGLASSPENLALPLLQEDPQFAFEVGELLEVLVHAGEPDVGDVVQPAKLGQDLDPHFRAGHQGAAAPELVLDPGRQLFDLLGGHGAVLDRLGHPRH